MARTACTPHKCSDTRKANTMEKNLSKHGVDQLKFWLEAVCLESVHTTEHIDRAIESVESNGGFEVSPQRTKSKLPEMITAEEDWFDVITK